jgi:uncharacterized membrane protein (Fun14 family)
MSRTSIYVHSCIVCFNVFLEVGVYCISYTCFQKINVIKINKIKNKKKKKVAYIVYVRLKEKSVLCENSVIIILRRSRYYVLRR